MNGLQFPLTDHDSLVAVRQELRAALQHLPLPIADDVSSAVGEILQNCVRHGNDESVIIDIDGTHRKTTVAIRAKSHRKYGSVIDEAIVKARRYDVTAVVPLECSGMGFIVVCRIAERFVRCDDRLEVVVSHDGVIPSFDLCPSACGA